MIELCALASGSNGNCYYIGTEEEAVLIDIGIHYKSLKERFTETGLDFSKVKAAFISHEHSDHVQGARVTSKRTSLPVWYSKRTFYKCYDKNKAPYNSFFENGASYTIGQFTIYPFSKNHDAAEPSSFRIEVKGKHIGVMTDIGMCDKTLINEFSKCDAVFLESNYDPEMLSKGPYPYYLQQRVSSSKGHLSNQQAVDLIENHASNNLQTVFLSHISAVNNSTEIVKEQFKKFDNTIRFILTSRYSASEIIHI